MIRPTVGRVVLYTPQKTDELIYVLGEKLAAIICKIWSDTCVNLAVFDANGVATNVTSVPLIQDMEPKPDGGFYCEWMEYQKGQAAKTEKLEKESENRR
jgi:hypothetical protein